MAIAVVTVASGGVPVVDVTATVATNPNIGRAVSEAANGRGLPVTKVTSGGRGVIYVTPAIGNP
jgi:uncharacterized protein (AIM24 family)